MLTTALITPAVASFPVMNIVRIEEDWEMVLAEPEPDRNAPQVTTIISPFADLDSVYAVFDLNHRSQPDYIAGGMQLQIWQGEELVSVKNNSVEGSLSHTGEVVTWTQSMDLTSGNLTFAISNGNSQTWGEFGSGGTFKVSVTSTMQNLNQYGPEISAENSGVGYAGNRVSSLKLKAVRCYTQQGLVWQMSTSIVVHQN